MKIYERLYKDIVSRNKESSVVSECFSILKNSKPGMALIFFEDDWRQPANANLVIGGYVVDENYPWQSPLKVQVTVSVTFIGVEVDFERFYVNASDPVINAFRDFLNAE